jgi:predicted transcriptional regulator
MFSDLRKMRLLCGLRQIEVAVCTGVSVFALAEAEHGRRPLNDIEHSIVVSFLRDRWRLLELAEKDYQNAASPDT